MEGAYKSKLSERQLNEVIQAKMNSTIRSYSELTEGWANSAYSIEMEDGKKVVLKARPPADIRYMRCEVDQMKTEVDAMRRLASNRSLPIPHIYVYDQSLELLPVEYFIMEHLEGKPYNQVKAELPEEQRDAIERRLGELNYQINECIGEGFGFYSRPTDRSWRDTFKEMIFGVLEDGKEAGVSLPIAYPELERLIEERLYSLDEVIEPRLLHWDLWDGNVFVKDGQLSGIIDFERAIWGDPIMEHYFSHFNPSVPFRQGYGISLTEPSQLARRKLYDLYLDLILYIECAFRKYDNENHVKWAYDNLAQGLERFCASE
ncbi:phosphotransferase family protein [Cohnella herbarum]|uniref:Aminoglycoside phosphotransferase family protein n=1 Tax=Cohnella herbarum TaxID=2728023 RepID=A0A7Z2VQ26_9BACL|nr:aminoglycoside phosphotransferase family protein [Cohnella herbarum]QJD87029.1 aminoglycoside phosphotransferase family protein [Cohnella herbarum]